MTRGRYGPKTFGEPEKSQNGPKQEKSWIIVHEFGRPRGPGTGANGVHPRVAGGPPKAHSCLGRDRWCRPETYAGLPRVVPSEPREGKSEKEMKV